MGVLAKLSQVFGDVKWSSKELATRPLQPYTRPRSEVPMRAAVEIPLLISAKGWERCARCGQTSSTDQLIYAYRGGYFGSECIGRILIIEREQPGITDANLPMALAKDQKKFRALGMARAAKRMMKDAES